MTPPTHPQTEAGPCRMYVGTTDTHIREVAFGTEPHALHKIRRAPLNPFFSKRAVAALQPRIEEIIEDLCSGLRGCMHRNEVVELRPAFLSLAIDVVFRYCKFAIDYTHSVYSRTSWVFAGMGSFDD